MTEYSFGPDGIPVGPDLDSLTAGQRESLNECAAFFVAHVERIRHFADRVAELGRSGADTVITLINVDDPTGHGRLLADLLMPGHDWQQYRAQGEVPVARGLAIKEPLPGILAELGYDIAARELADTDDLRVVVLHAGTVQVMEVQFD